MKTAKIIASFVFVAGILLCGGTNFEVFAAEEETAREVDESYKDCYEQEVQLVIAEKNDKYEIYSIGKTIQWEAEKVEEDMYTSCNAFARKKSPNVEYKDETVIPGGTSIKRVGISENGWDIIEYEGELYFMWYTLITPNKPVVRTPRRVTSDYASGVGAPTVNEEAAPAEPTGDSSYVGTYELTAYTWTGDPCANGEFPTSGYTVACNSLPLGTRVYIEGIGERVVEDTGGMGGGVVDIYMDSHDSCIQFGRQSANVYVIE